MSEDVAAATTVPATAAETSPDNPPLQLLSQKLKMHIDRAPSAWIEARSSSRRGTNAYLTLRDIDAEISSPRRPGPMYWTGRKCRWNAAPGWWP